MTRGELRWKRMQEPRQLRFRSLHISGTAILESALPFMGLQWARPVNALCEGADVGKIRAEACREIEGKTQINGIRGWFPRLTLWPLAHFGFVRRQCRSLHYGVMVAGDPYVILPFARSPSVLIC